MKNVLFSALHITFRFSHLHLAHMLFQLTMHQRYMYANKKDTNKQTPLVLLVFISKYAVLLIDLLLHLIRKIIIENSIWKN